ncbi:hypothetical protein GALMADRAFT_1063167 [Galerina marginata CBS 339.88]|uniref:Uncharacterized protein n=1 Tax=Galerina marginata (strain CBS 339.88) TaxID=685588 RepID=A0A067SJ97_GALM3|nr:hypothetical protein GALMADRAFT_1063167 [Galerina marginata CBS 339.88]
MDNYLELLAGYQQWPKTLGRIEREWRAVCAACVVILPLSIAFIQLDGVMDNIPARTMGLAALIFSSSGLITGGVYLIARINLEDVKFRDRWVEASRSLKITGSTKFWACIVSPVVFLVW